MYDKEGLRARLAFIRQGSEVERFHTKRMIQRNDVGHHSFHVAWLAWLMAMAYAETDVRPSTVVMAALAHDLAEHITGDMPGDFKRELGLREQFGEYERERFSAVGLEFESILGAREKRVLKLADMMEGALFCVSEASLGNGRVGGVFKNFRTYISKFAPFNECETAIIEYIDDLWAHYGVDFAHGWDKTAHTEESMSDESIVGDDPAQRAYHEEKSLIDIVRREEAEGRATLPPLASEQPADPSKAAKTGDAPVPEQALNPPVDDLEQPDLAAGQSQPLANARQHGGDHYKGTGYEHWDLVLDTGMNYFQGCATKYVTRARKHEAGQELNLLKAIHYVDKAQEAEEQGRLYRANFAYSVDDVRNFQAANQLNELEYDTILDIIGWRWGEARENLNLLRQGLTEPVQPAEGRVAYGQVDEQ